MTIDVPATIEIANPYVAALQVFMACASYLFLGRCVARFERWFHRWIDPGHRPEKNIDIVVLDLIRDVLLWPFLLAMMVAFGLLFVVMVPFIALAEWLDPIDKKTTDAPLDK